MDVKAIPGEENDKLTCPRCQGKVFEAERCVTRVGSFHKPCFSCIECSKKLDSTNCCEGILRTLKHTHKFTIILIKMISSIY